MVPGSDLPESQTMSVAAEYSELNRTDHGKLICMLLHPVASYVAIKLCANVILESVKFAINGEESDQSEQTASQTNALRQRLDSTVINDELLRDDDYPVLSASDHPEEKDDPSTQHSSAEGESRTAANQWNGEESEYYNVALSGSNQPKEKDDPSTRHSCAEEEIPAAADQQIWEESEYYNHLGQEQDMERHCSHLDPQPECWDIQQSTAGLEMGCQAAGEGSEEIQGVAMKEEGGQPERELKDKPLKLEGNRVELNHTAQCHSESHQEGTAQESNVDSRDESELQNGNNLKWEIDNNSMHDWGQELL